MKMMLSSLELPQTWQLSTATLEFVPNALLVFFVLALGMGFKAIAAAFCSLGQPSFRRPTAELPKKGAWQFCPRLACRRPAPTRCRPRACTRPAPRLYTLPRNAAGDLERLPPLR